MGAFDFSEPSEPAPNRRPERSSFKTGFGLGTGCIVGIAFGFGVAVLGILLVCAGVIHLGSKAKQDADAARGDSSPDAKEKVAGIGSWSVVGDVRMKISSATIAVVPLNGIVRPGESESEHLIVRVEIQNTSKTRKADYRSPQGLFHIRCAGKDELGNTYKTVTFGLGERVVGAVDHDATLQPGSDLSDIYVFQRPVKAARTITIEVDAECVEGKGTFRFTFPVSSISSR